VVSSNGVRTVLRTVLYGNLRFRTALYGGVRCWVRLSVCVSNGGLYGVGSVLRVRSDPLQTLAAVYLRRVRVAGFVVGAPPLTHVWTVLTPPAPAALALGVGLQRPLPGEVVSRHA
jgi:hypothetical protein